MCFSNMPRKPGVNSSSGKTTQKQSCCICCQAVTPGKDEALYCVGKCQQWLHRYCASVTIQQFKDINDNSEEFFCPTCCRERHREQICELTNVVSELRQEIVQLKESVSKLSTSPPSDSAPGPQRSYATVVHGHDGDRHRRRHSPRQGRAVQVQGRAPPSAKPRSESVQAVPHLQKRSPEAAKVLVNGARRLWGTRSETSSAAVRKAIAHLCRGYDCSQLKIRRKTKVLSNNRLSWWFVLHNSKESLKELESQWEPLRLQTDCHGRLSHASCPDPHQILHPQAPQP